MPSEEKFLVILEDWMQAHHGFRPRLNIYRNGKHLTAAELKKEPELYEEYTLARRLSHFLRYGIKDKAVRTRLAEIAEIPTVARWENPKENQFYDGFRNPLPSQYLYAEQLQSWVEAHDGKRPRSIFYAEHNKYRPVDQLTPEEYQEYTLANRLLFLLSKGHLEREVRIQLEHIHGLPIWHPEKENR